MGNIIGHSRSFILRKARRFNIENRAHKFLEEEKISAAPKPEATLREIELIKTEQPNLMEEIHKYNPALVEKLRHVYVTSDKLVEEPDRNADKKLPLSRNAVRDDEFGYREPSDIKPGRLTLRNAVEMLTLYQTEKENNSIEDLAAKYKIKLSDAENIVDYYHLFTFIGPKEDKARMTPIQSTISKLSEAAKRLTHKDGEPQNSFKSIEKK